MHSLVIGVQEGLRAMGHRATIADVAREAGVSQQTVSRALNNKGEISPATRARVLAIIDRLGYRPSSIARGLVTRHTTIFGLVVPDIANPFFSEVARGAEDAAREAGYSLLLGNTIENPEREAEILATLESQQVDGIILCSSRLSDADLLAAASHQMPVVLVNRRLPDSSLRGVSVDDEAGAVTAVEHLIARGCHCIAYLAGPLTSQSGQRRAAGYRKALQAAGLPLQSGLMVQCAPTIDGGRLAADALLGLRPDIDALYCYNDLVATGALQAAACCGRRVPADLAVVGSDDILLAALVSPALTTMRSDKRALGSIAVKMLLDRINECPDGCPDVVLQPELIVRESA